MDFDVDNSVFLTVCAVGDDFECGEFYLQTFKSEVAHAVAIPKVIVLSLEGVEFFRHRIGKLRTYQEF